MKLYKSDICFAHQMADLMHPSFKGVTINEATKAKGIMIQRIINSEMFIESLQRINKKENSYPIYYTDHRKSIEIIGKLKEYEFLTRETVWTDLLDTIRKLLPDSNLKLHREFGVDSVTLYLIANSI